MLRSTVVSALAVCLALSAVTASAADFAAGSLTIENPWARPTDPMAKTSAAYFTVKNKGAADKLVGVSSDVAASTMLHQMVNKDGMMIMQHVDSLSVPAGGSAVLKPGSYHVMFVGLKAQLKAGTAFPLHLTFEKAGKVTVQVAVQRPEGARAEAGKEHGQTGGMKH